MFEPKIVIRKRGDKMNVDVHGNGDTIYKMMENAFVHIIYCAKIPGASFELAMEAEFKRLREVAAQYEKGLRGENNGNARNTAQ